MNFEFKYSDKYIEDAIAEKATFNWGVLLEIKRAYDAITSLEGSYYGEAQLNANLVGQVKIMREALEWYANTKDWPDVSIVTREGADEMAKCARKALYEADKFWETLVNGDE